MSYTLFYTGCELLYEQTVMEVAEDAGEIELFRISKLGQTELPVTIYINGSTYDEIPSLYYVCVCVCVCLQALSIA